MNADAQRARLDAGLAGLGLTLDEAQEDCLIDYLALLSRWNRAYNLTAVDEPTAMVDRHLIDSLSILPWIEGREIVDAGTGAGLPGVPLAIVCPERHFVLVDSNGKKVRFLRQVRRELNLENIEPVQARLEAFEPDTVPDQVVARALAPLPRLVEQLGHLLAAGATLLAMKGRLEDDECAAVADAYNVDRIELNVPGADSARSLAILRKS
ncbi:MULTISPECIES: 16S rRNA (guanine(527)-N(7))-methyltransferase RsmG [unclassified Wenzhouxiangella]|uniref:16S rRNA (guanine(527)-N(7))-methyltransferase RsmG n=1 Tax=unclassified Wenzhouxiangella TaxID=2613841 RepID=UPI000E32C2A3|nr:MULTISPECIES: 16S rRNA (guanine(527)-N(7))-methyltransferase RsmG [unclassified Wenzhouxiangella]RFF26251.1 16S rRNA (guanine(527)-N(7))-methyltransferase RsmG [Wenzhouxiangella sp. 15181]RFP68247.1 16S rRNA (guanine(527)-N(7))-methyltransferase RsmG [Wenzhouxiangella sp. 15190]